MKQRVAIARVLANQAEIPLMDEPFGALDALILAKLQDHLSPLVASLLPDRWLDGRRARSHCLPS